MRGRQSQQATKRMDDTKLCLSGYRKIHWRIGDEAVLGNALKCFSFQRRFLQWIVAKSYLGLLGKASFHRNKEVETKQQLQWEILQWI